MILKVLPCGAEMKESKSVGHYYKSTEKIKIQLLMHFNIVLTMQVILVETLQNALKCCKKVYNTICSFGLTVASASLFWQLFLYDV